MCISINSRACLYHCHRR